MKRQSQTIVVDYVSIRLFVTDAFYVDWANIQYKQKYGNTFKLRFWRHLLGEG